MTRALFLSLVLFAYPAPADACLNEVELSLDEAAGGVRRAESLLSTGHLRRAHRTAGRALRDMRSMRSPSLSLRQRARFVRALAIIRLGGQLTPRSNTANEIVEARATLRSQHEAHPNSVVHAAAFAEALALDRTALDQAFDLLSPLEAVLPDVHAHAVLARLFARRGDDAARDRVLGRCRARANGRERGVCRVNA